VFLRDKSNSRLTAAHAAPFCVVALSKMDVKGVFAGGFIMANFEYAPEFCNYPLDKLKFYFII
jgi:hypothetical protein